MKNNLIHKTADVERGAKIGKDTVVWNNSQIKKGAVVGDNCIIGHNCFIDSGAKIGDKVKIQSNTDIWNKVTLENYSFVGPSAVFTNDLNPRSKYPKTEDKWLPTLVKEGATIGANATILCGITIGKWAIVGAGAVVTKDVPDYSIVIGVPAKPVRWVCECGKKIVFLKNESKCSFCKRNYKKKGEEVWQIK